MFFEPQFLRRRYEHSRCRIELNLLENSLPVIRHGLLISINRLVSSRVSKIDQQR